MGTVLHLNGLVAGPVPRFSPLLDGDGVASSHVDEQPVDRLVSVPFSMGTVLHRCDPIRSQVSRSVSVPFSMGTVLHLRHREGRGRTLSGFSPLLDGDGVASCVCHAGRIPRSSSFSPLLDGDGVASLAGQFDLGRICAVSVPFSMGTVLHSSSCGSGLPLFPGFSPLLDGDGVASAPEQSHSTPLIGRREAHFPRRSVSASKAPDLRICRYHTSPQ